MASSLTPTLSSGSRQRGARCSWPHPMTLLPPQCIDGEARAANYTSSLNLPDKTLQFVKDHPLMDDSVTPIDGRPRLIKKDVSYTQIVVDRTKALDGTVYDVMFLSTGEELPGSTVTACMCPRVSRWGDPAHLCRPAWPLPRSAPGCVPHTCVLHSRCACGSQLSLQLHWAGVSTDRKPGQQCLWRQQSV